MIFWSPLSIFDCYALNRGKNNRRTLIGMAKRWLQPLNRGGRYIKVLFTVHVHQYIILTLLSGN